MVGAAPRARLASPPLPLPLSQRNKCLQIGVTILTDCDAAAAAASLFGFLGAAALPQLHKDVFRRNRGAGREDDGRKLPVTTEYIQ